MGDLQRLVFCVPTYNRSAMVEEFLEQFAPIFYQLKIDICFYDSSEDNTTELLVKRSEEWCTKILRISVFHQTGMLITR